MPLAATHYYFIREIPTFASYEVRMSVQAWDQKWVCVNLVFFFFFLTGHTVLCRTEICHQTQEIKSGTEIHSED
jgi:hypothetical protein